jgi:hypothetical protein
LWGSLEAGSSGERKDVEDRSVSAIDRCRKERTKMLGDED